MSTTSIGTRLATSLNIRPGEGRLVSMVFLFGLLVAMVTTLARTTSFSLFLATYSSDRLPYVYLGLSISSVLVSFGYLRASGKLPLSTVLVSTFIALVVSAVALRVGLDLGASDWLFFSLPIWWGVLNVLLFTTFWNLAGRLFNLQQAKRLFGLLSASAQIGTIVIGLLTPVLVALVGAVNLLVITALLIGATLVVLIGIVRIWSAPLKMVPESDDDTNTTSMSTLIADNYIRLLFIVFTLFIVGIYFVDNIFYSQAEMRFSNADELANFTGAFFGVVGVISLVLQTFVIGRLMNRFGVTSMILITPVVLLAGTVGIALVGTFTEALLVVFWLAVLTNLARCVLDAVDNTAVNVLYQPLPVLQRTRAQTIVDGIFYPVGIGIAGVALILLRDLMSLDSVQVSWMLIAVLAAWLLGAVSLGRAYPDKLAQALRSRNMHVSPMPTPDSTSLGVIRNGLESAHPGSVMYALDLVEQIDPPSLGDDLDRLLEHHDVLVRLDVLRRIERLGLSALTHRVQQRLSYEGSRDVRSLSVRVIASLGDADQIDVVAAFLHDPDPLLRRGALLGLLRSGEVEGILEAGEQIGKLVASDDPADREMAATVIGAAGVSGFYRPILRLIADDESRVRRAATEAAGLLQHPRLWPGVAARLDDRQCYATATRALIAGGAAVLPSLAAMLEDQRAAPTVQVRCANICGEIGDPDAIPLLKGLLYVDHLGVRSAALTALTRCGYRIPAGELHEAISQEVRQVVWLLGVLRDLGQDTAFDHMRAALNGDMDLRRSRIFDWLSLHYDTDLVQRMRAGFAHASAEQRSYALELLDVRIAPGLKALLVPVLDDISPEQRLRRLQTHVPQARSTSANRLFDVVDAPKAELSSWARACAIHAVGLVDLDGLVERVRILTDSPDPVVRDTARWVLLTVSTGGMATMIRPNGHTDLPSASRLQSG